MQTAHRVLFAAALLIAAAASADKARDAVQSLLPRIHAIAADPQIVSAVKLQNARQLTLDAIQKQDRDWMASTGVTDVIRAHLENACARALRKHQLKLPAVEEAFAMDNQGALVGSLKRTSDYWQGDEAKWQRSFANGKGADFIDKARFDESSQAYTVQVSVPVLDGGKAIGALTVGINLDRI